MKQYLIIALLILTAGYASAQNGNSVLVDGTLQVTEQTGSPTELVGQSAAGFFSHITVGDGLTLTSGTLKTSGGGLIFADITPDAIVGVNSAHDTITEVTVTYFDQPGPTSVYEVNNIRLQNDTLYALRGSFFQGFETAKWAKTIGAGVTDTLNIDPEGNGLFDFTESGGRYTYVQPDQFAVFQPQPGYNQWVHRFLLHGSISIHTSSPGDITLAIYANGVEMGQCVTEFYLGGNERSADVDVDCQYWAYNGDVIDLRLTNNTAGSINYTIERANLNATHIKSRVTPTF